MRTMKYQDEPKEKDKKIKIGGRRRGGAIKMAKAQPMIKPLKLDVGKKPKG